MSSRNSTVLIRHYRLAVTLNPSVVEAYNNLGTALASAGRIDDAIVEFRQALTIRPDYTEATFNLAAAVKILRGGSR